MADTAPIIEITDIIQSLQNKNWTGTLEVVSNKDDRSSYMFFEGGLIQHCKVDRSRVILGQALYELGQIDKADYMLTLADYEQTGRRFGEVLLDLGLVDQQSIRSALVFQAREDILDTLNWKDVDARFHAETEPLPLVFSSEHDTEVKLGISGMGILMEAARRADEWSIISQHLPHEHELVTTTQGALLPSQVAEPQLALLIDGYRSAFEIAEEAPQAKLECLRLLADLVEQGHLRVLAPNELVQVGIEAEGDEEFEKALRVYELARERGLEHVDLDRRLARCHQQLGQKQEAMDLWIRVSERCVADGRQDKAIEALQEAAVLDPADLTLRQRLVRLLVETQANDAATQQLRNLVQLTKEQEGQRGVTIELLVQLLELEPTDMEAMAELSQQYLDDGDPVQAMATLGELAGVHLDQGGLEPAVEVYYRILQIDSENLEARLRLAQCLAELGSTGDAVREYRRLADTLYRSGVIGNSINWPFLIKVYESIIELEPSSTPAWEWLAKAYLENGDEEKAISRFLGMATSLKPQDGSAPPPEILQPLRRVVELAPARLDVRGQLVEAHVQLLQPERAVRELRALAEEAITQGNLHLAHESYQRAVGIQPFDMDSRRGLAALSEQAGQAAQAQAMWRDIGGICLRAGLHQAAVSDLRRSLSLRSDDADTVLDCACAEQLAGNAPAAGQLYAEYAQLMLARQNYGLAREALDQASRIAPELTLIAQLAAKLAQVPAR